MPILQWVQLNGGVLTSRLVQTERDLDLERATREDIIKAEVERRMRDAERISATDLLAWLLP